MQTKAAGNEAPLVTLQTAIGHEFSLADVIGNAPIHVLAFFKTSCPVCQTAFPFLERIHQNYPNMPIWGISQDDASETDRFARNFEITFPMLLDESLEWTVQYGLISVPSIFVIDEKGTIETTYFGFAKVDLDELNQRMARAARSPVRPLFTEDDDVPTMKPG